MSEDMQYKQESSYLTDDQRKDIVDYLLKKMWKKGYQNIFPEVSWIKDFINDEL